MIRLVEVTKIYPGGVTAVNELSLDIPDGVVCVLVGPSGCGKTTTLRMINRLIERTSGTIEVSGDDIARLDPVELRRRIGYVIQQVGLFPHLTVGGNVATVPRLVGWDRRRTAARVDELLELVGLEPSVYRDRYPAELSGGQQQRVGVARALGADPPVLLMDEPFGAIDPVTRARLQKEFLRLQATLRKTVVIVTHDIDEAVLLGDRIALLEQGGVLAQYGTPEELLTAPANEFVASFVGRDRGLKRLSLSVVPTEVLRPLPPEGLGERPVLDTADSLRDALAQALVSPTGEVVIAGDDGEPLGLLSLDDLLLAARPPAEDTEAPPNDNAAS
jgi:osmoprotectant transport system ATP-binding protein